MLAFRKSGYAYILLLLCTAMALVACGGSSSSSSPSQSDESSLSISLEASQTNVEPNEIITVEATLSGEGAESVVVLWEASAGELPNGNRGESITWKAPDSNGRYTITAKAGSVQETIAITVGEASENSYHVQGVVFSSEEGAVEGAKVIFSDGYGYAVTNEWGEWIKGGLEGTVTVRVEETDTIKPTDLDGNVETVFEVDKDNSETWLNFYVDVLVLVDEPYTASGTVKDTNKNPVAGVEISANYHEGTAVTDSQGAFSLTNIEIETVLAASKEGYVIFPTMVEVDGPVNNLEFEALTLEEATLEFEDPVLEQHVREAIEPYVRDFTESDPITLAHVPLITSLYPYERDVGISSLGGIEALTEIDTLYIRGDNSGVTSLEPLSALNKLRLFSIEQSGVTSLEGLNPTSLTDVTVKDSQLADISAAQGFTKLNVLNLSNNPLSDISPLASVALEDPANSVRIDLQKTKIADISPLTNFPLIGQLDLSNNPVLSDITPLKNTSPFSVDLRNTTGVDWCSDDSAWDTVNNLRNREITVVLDRNNCVGEYSVSGQVTLVDDSRGLPGQIVLYVESDAGRQQVIADGRGNWVVDGVKGSTQITPRFKAAHNYTDIVLRFSPSNFTVIRSATDVDFEADITSEPVIDGWVLNESNEPAPNATVRFENSDNNESLGTARSDAYGYFSKTLDNANAVNVRVERGNLIFGDRLAIIPPAQLKFTGLVGEGKIAFFHDNALYSINPDGTGKTLITTTDSPNGNDSLISWSPDGSALAYITGPYRSGSAGTTQHKLHTIKADGSEPKVLVDKEHVLLTGVSWGANHTILYSERRSDGHQPAYNPWMLWSISPTGADNTKLTNNAHDHFTDASWDATAERFAVTMGPTGEMSRDPAKIRFYKPDMELEEEFQEGRQAAISPANNRSIAYINHDDELMIGTRASALVPYKVANEASRPSWSPDGKLIVFESGGKLYITDELETTQPRYLTEGINPSWSPN